MKQLKKILIMAGGTGGHVFPGLAVAEKCREKNIEILWLGTAKGLEAKLVPAANILLKCIPISGLRGKNWRSWLLAPFYLIWSIFAAAKIIRQFKPDVVLGFGGFVSGPGGIASWLLGYPLVIHEQNAKPGTTNRWLSYVARRVLQGFPNVFTKAVTVGNPLRAQLTELTATEKTWPDQIKRPVHLLILGGSLGAASLNQILPKAIALLPNYLRPEIKHQSGEKLFSDTIRAWQTVDAKVDVQPFIDDMAAAYFWADVVICRAGALTVSELCAVGRGAILVPYPYAIDDHQTANAAVMVKTGAGILLQQSALDENILAAKLTELISTPESFRLMGELAFKSREISATEKIVRLCEEIVL